MRRKSKQKTISSGVERQIDELLARKLQSFQLSLNQLLGKAFSGSSITSTRDRQDNGFNLEQPLNFLLRQIPNLVQGRSRIRTKTSESESEFSQLSRQRFKESRSSQGQALLDMQQQAQRNQ